MAGEQVVVEGVRSLGGSVARVCNGKERGWMLSVWSEMEPATRITRRAGNRNCRIRTVKLKWPAPKVLV